MDDIRNWKTNVTEALAEVSGSADIFEWNAEETKRIYGQTVQSRFENTRDYY